MPGRAQSLTHSHCKQEQSSKWETCTESVKESRHLSMQSRKGTYLNCRWRLRRYVVHNTVHTLHFVCDTI